MKLDIVQLLMAALGSLGFGIFLRMNPKHLGWGTFGGALTWLIYLCLQGLGLHYFFGNLISALAANLWSWMMSKFRKAPAIIFTITAMVPLIPGGGLYDTMSALVHSNAESAAQLGTQTMLTAVAIGFGTLLFSAGIHLVNHFAKKKS